MRWILVFLFLYLIPIITLFRNYKGFKRSCIYSCIYTVLITTIVISNIYVSGLNNIKNIIYYKNSALNDYEENALAYKEEIKEVSKQVDEISKNNEEVSETKEIEEEFEVNYIDEESNEKIIQDEDLKTLNSFKKEVYEIELKALLPMRACIPSAQNISYALKNLKKVREDVQYAYNMCNEVVKIYEEMEMPYLLHDKDDKLLFLAKEEVKEAYILRSKAMQEALNLIDTKNPKYVSKITEYLNLSDNHMNTYKEKIEQIKKNILS